MGMFDYVYVRHNRAFACSEGHRLDEQYQTKSLDRLMLPYMLKGRKFERADRDPADEDLVYLPFSGTVNMYTECTECPAYVTTNGNIVQLWVEFDVVIERGIVKKVTRTSANAADWWHVELKKDYMEGATGPLSRWVAVRTRSQRMFRR